MCTDPTLVFSGDGDLMHTNSVALRVFSDSERTEAVAVWNYIQSHPELHPFPWSNAAGSAAYTVHPGKVMVAFLQCSKIPASRANLWLH